MTFSVAQLYFWLGFGAIFYKEVLSPKRQVISYLFVGGSRVPLGVQPLMVFYKLSRSANLAR